MNTDALFDMNLLQSQAVPGGASLTLRAEEGISGLYFIFDLPYESVTLTENDRTITVDTGGILHFYLDVEKALGQLPKRLLLTFSSGEAQVNELRIFSPGELPDWVEQWSKIPQGEADLLLLSTHGDDEQLFFAGLLPWYDVQQGKRVQVVYFTDHRNITSIRVHEMLRGLWSVGVQDYRCLALSPTITPLTWRMPIPFMRRRASPGRLCWISSPGSCVFISHWWPLGMTKRANTATECTSSRLTC